MQLGKCRVNFARSLPSHKVKCSPTVVRRCDSQLKSAGRGGPCVNEKTDALEFVALQAAQAGAVIVEENAKLPRQIGRKEGNDIVTVTDKAAEIAIIGVIQAAFPSHAIQGEEGGVLGGLCADYLWSIDPLDGTANFSTGYGSFCVSVGVVRHATPMAACIIEFVGGSSGEGYKQRVFTAKRNGGARLNGRSLRVSGTRDLRDAIMVTESLYMPDIPESWEPLSALQREFTAKSRGVRISGSAAANACALATGAADAYWQFNLKPWDIAAGALIIEEAGGTISTADGCAWSIFDRSLVATNDLLHKQVLEVTEPETARLRETGFQLGPWCVPKGYRVKAGAQLQ